MAIRDFVMRVLDDNGGPMSLGDFARVESKYSTDQISCAMAAMSRQGLLLPAGKDKYVPNTTRWSSVRRHLEAKARQKAQNLVKKQLEMKAKEERQQDVKKDKLAIQSNAPIEPALLLTIQAQGYSVTNSRSNRAGYRYEFERAADQQPAKV